ncbi:YceD family protein [soil metagenome]
MSSPRTDSRLNVADLLDRPGASRRVDVELAVPDDLDLGLAEWPGHARLVGIVESVVEGLLIRGTLRAPLLLRCARCLVPVEGDATSEVVELYADPGRAVADDVEPGYVIHDALLDLGVLLRDALVPAVPYRPLCRPDCRGLCATCGVDRNEADCACVTTRVDPRWDGLRGLRLPDEAE